MPPAQSWTRMTWEMNGRVGIRREAGEWTCRCLGNPRPIWYTSTTEVSHGCFCGSVNPGRLHVALLKGTREMSEISDNLFHFTEVNRRAWNEIAQVRHAKQPPASFFAEGNSTLDARELQAAGEVRGRRLLHLQCSTGEDTLSWSVAGAEATGVDISEEQIKLAQQKAAAAGLATRFLAADVYALPPDLQAGTFEYVFTGGGVLVWLPDLTRWAQVVAAALQPGGLFLFFEAHPI